MQGAHGPGPIPRVFRGAFGVLSTRGGVGGDWVHRRRRCLRLWTPRTRDDRGCQAEEPKEAHCVGHGRLEGNLYYNKYLVKMGPTLHH